MWTSLLLLLGLSGYCCAGPLGLKRNIPIVQHQGYPAGIEETVEADDPLEQPKDQRVPPELAMTLTLPSNATSIRTDITDSFSCDNKSYGYYADVENDCQIFHVCLPVTYADGKETTFRWSFICPEETIFSQDSFTCMRPEDMTIDCVESFKYYELNRNFGSIEEETNKSNNNNNQLSKTEEEPQAATIIQEEVQQPVEEEEVEMAVAPPAQVVVQPVKVTKKPIKSNIQHRRKPTLSQASSIKNKPTSSYQLRRVPPASVEPASTQNLETVVSTPIEEGEEEVKPISQKFNKRPSSMSTAIKEKISAQKPEKVHPLRTELYNQVRKRPSYFNKKDTDATQTTKPSEQTAEMSQPQLADPMPTLNLESIFTPAIQETPEHVLVSDNHEVSEAASDNSPQPSESAAVYVKPDEKPVIVGSADDQKSNDFMSIAPAQPEHAVTAEESLYVKPDEEPVIIGSATDQSSNDFMSIAPVQPEQVVTAEEFEKDEELKTSIVPEDSESLSTQILNTGEIKEVQESETPEQITVQNENLASEEPVDSGKPADLVVKATEAKKDADSPVEVTESEPVNNFEPFEKTDKVASEKPATENIPEKLEETAEHMEVHGEEAKPIPDSYLKQDTETDDQLTEEKNENSSKSTDTEPVVLKSQDTSNTHFAESAPEEGNPPTIEEASKVSENVIEPVEAIEEIPAVIAEVEEPRPMIEEAPKISENVIEPIKAIEEIPAVIAEVEEPGSQTAEEEKEEVKKIQAPQTEDNNAPSADITSDNKSSVDVASQTLEEMEDEKPIDAIETMPATPEMQYPDPIVQAMFDNTLKQSSGGFKPVDPQKAAEAEALITDFLSTLMKSETTNSRPIYPGESQPEAEILENTKDEMKDESPASSVEIAEEIVPETKPAIDLDTKSDILPEAVPEIAAEPKPDILPEAVPEIAAETKPEYLPQSDNVKAELEAIDVEGQEETDVERQETKQESKVTSIEEQSVAVPEFPEEPKAEPEIVEAPMPENENKVPLSNMLMFHQLPESMYQIPVKVITAPVEGERKEEEKLSPFTTDNAADESLSPESQPNEVTSSVQNEEKQNVAENIQQTETTADTAAYTSLSIDDIVDLVKERLDQKPVSTQDGSAELLVAQTAEDMITRNGVQDEEKPDESLSDEEIIMPIYQRVGDANSNLLKTHHLLVNEPTAVAKDSEDTKTDKTEETHNAIEDSKQTPDVLPDSESAPAEERTEVQQETQEVQGTPAQSTEVQPKAGRSYRSRSMKNAKMDPRKRRFLFRSDAS